MGAFQNGYIRLRSLVNRALKGHRLDIENVPRALPRTIWMYWAQGLDDAPEIVKICVQSWRDQNPGWDLRLITDETLSNHLDRSRYAEAMTPTNVSDMLRLQLLRKHGGIWADATSFCARPVDDWLVPLMQGGFFAFARPTPGRIMANWLMASEPEGTIIARLSDVADAYWLGRSKASDYFWFHYSFEWLAIVDQSFRKAWKQVPKISADGPHVLFAKQRENALEDIDPTDPGFMAIPVHKLSWKEPLPDHILKKWGWWSG